MQIYYQSLSQRITTGGCLSPASSCRISIFPVFPIQPCRLPFTIRKSRVFNLFLKGLLVGKQVLRAGMV